MLSASSVCSCAHFLVHIAHETAGAARTRLSLRPLFSKRAKYFTNLGRVASREGEFMPHVIASEAKQSISPRNPPEPLDQFSLQPGGSRECRVRAAPAVSCAKLCEKNAHEHTGSAETLRHSPRNGFTAYGALSSATNSSCHRHRRIEGLVTSGWANQTSADLTPATGARTTRFCRTLHRRSSGALQLAHGKAALRSHLRTRSCRVHRIPLQRS